VALEQVVQWAEQIMEFAVEEEVLPVDEAEPVEETVVPVDETVPVDEVGVEHTVSALNVHSVVILEPAGQVEQAAQIESELVLQAVMEYEASRMHDVQAVHPDEPT
jgi:hypothetical protein